MESALTLKQFMRRRDVLTLYRQFFRTIRKLPAGERPEVADWVRSDFKSKKAIDPKDEEAVKALIYQGRKMLKELQQSVDFATAS